MDATKLSNLTVESFDIDTERGPVTIRFPMDPDSVTIANIQTGNFFQHSVSDPVQNLIDNFADYYAWNWQQCEDIGTFDLAENARILDLGAGLSIIDLIFAQQRSDTKFWLVDRGINSYQADNIIKHGEDHPYYNSWLTVEQLIALNQIDRKRFTLQPPDGPWPTDMDLIISTWCWCWHVPFSIYWQRILASLKPGGRLCVDIRKEHFDELVPVINRALGSMPLVSLYQSTIEKIDHSKPVTGFRCLWQRQ